MRDRKGWMWMGGEIWRQLEENTEGNHTQDILCEKIK